MRLHEEHADFRIGHQFVRLQRFRSGNGLVQHIAGSVFLKVDHIVHYSLVGILHGIAFLHSRQRVAHGNLEPSLQCSVRFKRYRDTLRSVGSHGRLGERVLVA